MVLSMPSIAVMMAMSRYMPLPLYMEKSTIAQATRISMLSAATILSAPVGPFTSLIRFPAASSA